MARALPKTTTLLRPRWYVLGSVRLECNHQRVQLPTRQVESLHAFLMLPLEPYAHEQIAARLWGEASDKALRLPASRRQARPRRGRWLSSMPA